MMQGMLANGVNVGTVLLAGSAVGLYFASRALAGSLDRRGRQPTDVMALSAWMPIAGVVLLAAFWGHLEIALGAIFATSLSSLLLIGGMASLLAPMGPGVDSAGSGSAQGRRIWPFVLPVGAMLVLMGFRGSFTLIHALALGVGGAMLLKLWLDLRPKQETVPADLPPAARPMVRRLESVLAIALAGIGAWAAIRGTEHLAQSSRLLPAGVVTVAFLTPILLLPLLVRASAAGTPAQSERLLGQSVLLTLMNLCLLLPAVIVIHRLRFGQDPSFPLLIWRLDCALLVGLGLLLLVVSTGRLALGRTESLVMIIVYGAYVMAKTALGVRL